MLATCPLPTLHAISAFGTKLCLYKTCPGHSDPSYILADPRLDIETKGKKLVPEECWQTDILDKDGERVVKGVAQDIKEMLRSLKA